MKRYKIVGVVMIAIFALSAMLAATASAETTLLAEYLVLKAKIAAGVELATETTGEIILEDTKAPIVGKASVLCSGTFDGTITGESGLGFILALLNLAGVEVTEAAPLLCERVTNCEPDSEASPIKVWVLGLPWHTEIVLLEAGTFTLLILLAVYHVVCLILGVSSEDVCESAETSGGAELSPIENDPSGAILVPTGAMASPDATCSLGGAASGLNTTEGDTLTKLVSGESLEVSSE